jgi:hypothetical protein
LGPLGTAATNRHIVPAPGDYGDGEIGGMIDKGNRSTRRKLAPVPLCPPQTPHACPDANPGRHGGKPATNRLSYDTASFISYLHYFLLVILTFLPTYLLTTFLFPYVAPFLTLRPSFFLTYSLRILIGLFLCHSFVHYLCSFVFSL